MYFPSCNNPTAFELGKPKANSAAPSSFNSRVYIYVYIYIYTIWLSVECQDEYSVRLKASVAWSKSQQQQLFYIYPNYCIAEFYIFALFIWKTQSSACGNAFKFLQQICKRRILQRISVLRFVMLYFGEGAIFIVSVLPYLFIQQLQNDH